MNYYVVDVKVNTAEKAEQALMNEVPGQFNHTIVRTFESSAGITSTVLWVGTKVDLEGILCNWLAKCPTPVEDGGLVWWNPIPDIQKAIEGLSITDEEEVH